MLSFLSVTFTLSVLISMNFATVPGMDGPRTELRKMLTNGMNFATMGCATHDLRLVKPWLEKPLFVSNLPAADRITLLTTLLDTMLEVTREDDVVMRKMMVDKCGFKSIKGHGPALILKALARGNISMFRYITDNLEDIDLAEAMGPALEAAANEGRWGMIQKIFAMRKQEESPLNFTLGFESIRDLLLVAAYFEAAEVFWLVADTAREEVWIEDYQMLQVINDSMAVCTERHQIDFFMELFKQDCQVYEEEYLEFSQQLPIIHPILAFTAGRRLVRKHFWLPKEVWERIRKETFEKFIVSRLEENIRSFSDTPRAADASNDDFDVVFGSEDESSSDEDLPRPLVALEPRVHEAPRLG